MSRYLIVFSFMGVMLLVTAAAAAREPVIFSRIDLIDTSKYPLVTSKLSVYDENGDFVSGLDETNLNLFLKINLKPVEVISLGERAWITLLIDKSGSMRRNSKAMKLVVFELVDLMEKKDRVMVAVFDRNMRIIHPFSAPDKEMIKQEINSLSSRGPTAFYDCLLAAVKETAKMPGKKSVIVITDGKDESRKYSPRLSTHSIEEVMEFARSMNVAVNTVALGPRACERLLENIARYTGGKYYSSPQSEQIRDLYQNVSVPTRGQYLIKFYSPLDPDCKNLRQLIIDTHVDDRRSEATKWYNP